LGIGQDIIMKTALIVQGGWPGHQPRECAAVVEAMLRAEGFGVTVADSTAAFADPAIRDFSLIVPIVTMSTIGKEEVECSPAWASPGSMARWATASATR
jgi:type 1 glutamine amidotransferase